jgi:uncharacterized membrane protein YdjX (TVP38/TMEM64 family)
VTKRTVASILKLALFVAFLGGAVCFFRLTETGQRITPHAVLEFVEGFEEDDPLLARLLYVGIYIVGTVLLLPGTVLSFAGAVLFGAYEGTLLTWLGATVGAVLAFLMARYLGRDFVNRLVGGRLQTLDRYIHEHGFRGLLILRLVPLFPFNGLNFGSGLTGIRLRDYLLATALGIVPGTFVYQFLFAKFHEKVLHDGFQAQDLLDPELLLALGIFVVFLVVGGLLARRLKARAEVRDRTF